MNFHFSDEQILSVLDVAKPTRQNIEARLRLMTTGEKYSLYRAAYILATRTPQADKEEK